MTQPHDLALDAPSYATRSSGIFTFVGVLSDPEAYRADVLARVAFADLPAGSDVFHGIGAVLDDQLPQWIRERFPMLTPTINAEAPETAVRERLGAGDAWMTMGAIAAAAEMKRKGLAADVARAGACAGPESIAVARAAASALA